MPFIDLSGSREEDSSQNLLSEQPAERTSWHKQGCKAQTLMTTALLVDVQLNTSMRTITGTLNPTPLPWLQVLSNIPPPHLRRQAATVKLLAKVRANDKLPLNLDITLHPAAHLPSRKPVWLDPSPENMTAISAWSDEWEATDVVNHSLVVEPSVCPPGFDLP